MDLILYIYVAVVVNFICQLDWTTGGCSDTWPNIILSKSVRMFPDDFNS